MTRKLSAIQAHALQTAADGIPLKAVARNLGITIGAAKSRRRDAMRKLGAKTVPAAVAAAIRAGVVD
jgi:DNA-binding CsgD family transcriptional regulator